MSSTPHLAIEHLAANTAQPEVVVNAIADALDEAINGEDTTTWVITGDVAVTQSQLSAKFLHTLSGTPSAAFKFDIDSGFSRYFGINNGTGQTCTVEVSGGSPAGLTVDVPDGQIYLLHTNGTDIVTFNKLVPFTIAYSNRGLMPTGVESPSEAQLLFSYQFTEAVTFPSGLTTSRGRTKTAATEDAVFSIQKNGSEVGTITFEDLATAAVFAMASDTSFAIGDYLDVYTPAEQDTTLADFTFTLRGTRD